MDYSKDDLDKMRVDEITLETAAAKLGISVDEFKALVNQQIYSEVIASVQRNRAKAESVNPAEQDEVN